MDAFLAPPGVCAIATKARYATLSVRHQQYHGTDIVTVHVEVAPRTG